MVLFDKDGKKKKALFGSQKMAPQLAISFFEGADKFVTGSADGFLYLWENGQAQKTFKIHDGCVQVLNVIGGKIYSSGNDKKLNVWDGEVKQLSSYAIPHYAKSIDVQGDCIIAGTRNGCIVEIAGGKMNVVMEGHSDGEVWGLAVCPTSGKVNFLFKTLNLLHKIRSSPPVTTIKLSCSIQNIEKQSEQGS